MSLMKYSVSLTLKTDLMKSSVVGMLTVDYFIIKVIDPANPKEGLNELRYIDPRKIRKVTEYEAKKRRNNFKVSRSKST